MSNKLNSDETSFAREVAKAVFLSGAVSAASTAGMVGGFILIAVVADKFRKDKDDTTPEDKTE